MIKALILYYLSIKPTHGYEIQKFIQVNEMDSWTKIQSGSIYYALNKLEKEGLIVLIEETGSGTKGRKLYSITERGKEELKELVKEELHSPICEVGSDKFIIFPLLNTLDKNVIAAEIKKHTQKLYDQKLYIEKWQRIKGNNQSLAVEKISFEMMLSNLEFQIKWHNALLDEMEKCIAAGKKMTKLISVFDFSNTQDLESNGNNEIDHLKYQILNDPQTAPEKLEQLIKMLKK